MSLWSVITTHVAYIMFTQDLWEVMFDILYNFLDFFSLQIVLFNTAINMFCHQRVWIYSVCITFQYVITLYNDDVMGAIKHKFWTAFKE